MAVAWHHGQLIRLGATPTCCSKGVCVIVAIDTVGQDQHSDVMAPVNQGRRHLWYVSCQPSISGGKMLVVIWMRMPVVPFRTSCLGSRVIPAYDVHGNVNWRDYGNF